METMSDRLRKARVAAGFDSARAAAMFFGWVVSTYSAHENGQNDFKTPQAIVYARAFKTTPEYLQFGTNPPAADMPSVDAQLRELPPEQAKALIERFNSMIEGVKLIRKIS